MEWRLSGASVLVGIIVLGIPAQRDVGFLSVFADHENSRPVVGAEDFIDKSGLMMPLRGDELIIDASHNGGRDVFDVSLNAGIGLGKNNLVSSAESIEGVIWEQGRVIASTDILCESTGFFLLLRKIRPFVRPFVDHELRSDVNMNGGRLTNISDLWSHAKINLYSLARNTELRSHAGAAKPDINMFQVDQ